MVGSSKFTCSKWYVSLLIIRRSAHSAPKNVPPQKKLSMGPRSSRNFCFWKPSETSKPSIHCFVQQIPWHLREAWTAPCSLFGMWGALNSLCEEFISYLISNVCLCHIFNKKWSYHCLYVMWWTQFQIKCAWKHLDILSQLPISRPPPPTFLETACVQRLEDKSMSSHKGHIGSTHSFSLAARIMPEVKRQEELHMQTKM